MFTGALGSTDIAKKNWEHFAVGAAITGIAYITDAYRQEALEIIDG